MKARGGGLSKSFEGKDEESFFDALSAIAQGEPHGSSMILGNQCSC